MFVTAVGHSMIMGLRKPHHRLQNKIVKYRIGVLKYLPDSVIFHSGKDTFCIRVAPHILPVQAECDEADFFKLFMDNVFVFLDRE